jgi:hypothetical protein
MELLLGAPGDMRQYTRFNILVEMWRKENKEPL